MRFLAPAVLALSLLSGSAWAGECVSEAKVRSDIAEFHVEGRVILLSGAEKDAFLAVINAMPPVTNITADKILIIDDATKPNAVLLLFNGDCAGRMLSLPRQLFGSILRNI